MKIKKVDDKPMVIHTKQKAKIHTHEPKQASIKGSKFIINGKNGQVTGMVKWLPENDNPVQTPSCGKLRYSDLRETAKMRNKSVLQKKIKRKKHFPSS